MISSGRNRSNGSNRSPALFRIRLCRLLPARVQDDDAQVQGIFETKPRPLLAPPSLQRSQSRITTDLMMKTYIILFSLVRVCKHVNSRKIKMEIGCCHRKLRIEEGVMLGTIMFNLIIIIN